MAARVDRGPPAGSGSPDGEGATSRFRGTSHTQRAAGEVAPVPVGLRPRRPSSSETRQMRRAPPLPVRRMYLPPHSP